MAQAEWERDQSMKIKTMLNHLRQLIDDKEIARSKRRKALKKVLKALKDRRNDLRKKSEKASGADKKKIDKKLSIIQAQRKKGVKALRDLKS